MRMHKLSLAVTLWLALSVAPPVAEAQDNDKRLAGVPGVRLVIEDLTDSAKRCGVNTDEIKSAAMYPLSGSNLTVGDLKQYQLPIFYIQIITVNPSASQGPCSSAINVRVYSLRSLKVYADFPNLFQVELWNKNLITISANSQHGRMVREAIETLTKEFVTAWNLDNKK